jgi:hypothetical protein
MAPTIPVPVVLGGTRHLWSENGLPNGVFDYEYCRCLCLSKKVHCGHDVEADFEPIFAATDGVVMFAGPDRYFAPHHVDLQPTVGPCRGEYHIYGHLSHVRVTTGQTVVRGQRIGTTGTAGTGPHLHWERRENAKCSPCEGYTQRNIDPTPVLSSPNANVSINGDIPEKPFHRTDTISVTDGPLRLRDGPGTGFPILEELSFGVQMCVTGEPQKSGGNTWYPVSLVNTNRPGWVAGEFCGLLQTGGCAGLSIGSAPAAPDAGDTAVSEAFSPHPDTGMPPEVFAERLTMAPQVEYDDDGLFVGVTFPEPPANAAAAEESGNPFAKG